MSAAVLPLSQIILRVLVPFAAGYLMTWLLRSVNAVVAPDLVRDLGLTASGLGLLTAAYFFTYAAMQLPLGLLLDRYGPRRTQASLFVLAALGCLGFALAQDELALTLARALIGLGLAGGLMAGFKTVALWLPRDKVSMGNGCYMAVGALGALLAATPSDLLVQAIGWRSTFVLLGAIVLTVAAAIYLVVPERGGGGKAESWGEQIGGLGRVFRDRLFWRVTPVVALTNGVALAVQSLWLGPWLVDAQGLTRDAAAVYLMACSLAFGIGVAGIGTLASALDRRSIGALQILAVALVPFFLAQIAMATGFGDPLLLVVVYGMTGQVGIVVHATFAAHFGVALAGRASTALNLVAFAIAFAGQYAVGGVIDLWPTNATGGYHPDGYRAAFAGALVLQLLGYVWFFVFRDRRATA
jgi:MFS family permease